MLPVQPSAYFDMFSQAQKLYGKQLEPVCKAFDLTRNEVDVLLFLYNNPQYDRASDIVTRRGMTKSHVSMSVASLAERNLLEREVSPEDRRTVRLRLAEEGSKIAAEAREAQKRFFDQLYQNLTREELEIWSGINRKVSENIERLNKP